MIVKVKLSDGTEETFTNVKGRGIEQGTGFIVLVSMDEQTLLAANPMHIMTMTFPEAANLVQPATGVSLA